MGSEAGYLLATLAGGGGTYRTTFPGRDFGAQIQKRPRNSKNFKKGRRNSKKSKKFRDYVAKINATTCQSKLKELKFCMEMPLMGDLACTNSGVDHIPIFVKIAMQT